MMSSNEDTILSTINTSNDHSGGKEKDVIRSIDKPELHNLLKSAFAEPFFFQPSNFLGQKIFPMTWNDLTIPKCFSEVLMWEDSTVEGSIEQCLNIVNSHVEFYKTDPEVTHDEKYRSDELVCLAEHLKNKLKKLNLKVASHPVNRVFEKLKEIFPYTDTTILLSKSKNHVQNNNDKEGELDLTEVIEDMLSCTPRPR